MPLRADQRAARGVESSLHSQALLEPGDGSRGSRPAACSNPIGRTPEPSKSAHRPQVVASNLKRALAAAGLDRPGVTAGSLQAFAANACYARTNRVEDVAELLGLHSLDRAMAKIDHQWQAAWADHVRTLGDR